MLEKRFDKKLNELTDEEQKAKDACWQKIESETGLSFEKPKGFTTKGLFALVSCCLVVCLILPIILFNVLDKKEDNIYRFCDTDYYITSSTETLKEKSASDINLLFVDDWYVDEGTTKLYVDINNSEEVLGILETAYDLETLDEIKITILYNNILFDTIEGLRADMSLCETYQNIDIYYCSYTNSNNVYFKYNGYTYFIECYYASSEIVSISAAKKLIDSRV